MTIKITKEFKTMNNINKFSIDKYILKLNQDKQLSQKSLNELFSVSKVLDVKLKDLISEINKIKKILEV